MTGQATLPTILFLLNHDAEHQVAHVAGLAAAAAIDGRVQVLVACGTEAIKRRAEALIGKQAAARIIWHHLGLPRVLDRLLSPLNKVAPVKRLARLQWHRELLASVDVLVSPERTCLAIKAKLGRKAPKFVFVPHGAGDRSVTYHPSMAEFDLMLVSGQKVIDEMVANGITEHSKCKIIGYPKFDTINFESKQKFFHNDNPTFVYNPHFDPRLSSWYDSGIEILEFFLNNQDKYNLIFAPHVMLFKKNLHYSLEYRRMRIRPNLPKKFLKAANVLVDIDSTRLFDMSYTLAADGYIGDVSSQVYEFLLRGGACYFLNRHSSGEVSGRYHFWSAGHVFESAGELTEQIAHWQMDSQQFAAEQRRLFAYTIDSRADLTASQRGASALIDYAWKVQRS